MKRSNPLSGAVTRLELIVLIGVVVVLAVLLLSLVFDRAIVKGQMFATLNNAKQIQIAALQMANDGVEGSLQGGVRDPDLAWPGDLAKRRMNPITTVSGYFRMLITKGYLQPTDVVKIASAPGVPPWDGSGELDGATQFPFKIYRVTAQDRDSTIFAASRNFTYGSALSSTQAPYEDKGFVVVRKDGSGLLLKKSQAKAFELIGTLPGRQSLVDRPVEQPDDILIQK